MMVMPRSYVQALPRRVKSTEFKEKGSGRSTRSSSNAVRSRASVSTSVFRSRDSSPATSESRNAKLQPQSPTSQAQDAPTRPGPAPIVPERSVPKYRTESTRDLLSSTAIPIRKKPKGRASQRLPKGDHVANFSTLLMGDFKPSSSPVPRSISHPNFEGLFGNMDELLEEGQMYIGSDGLDSGILSTRSLSETSLASMASLDGFLSDDRASQHSDTSQSVPERRGRLTVPSEDCTNDHPLSLPEDVQEPYVSPLASPQRSTSPPTLKSLAGKSDRNIRSSLTSSLTASLKALKSAAQTVSHRTYSPPPNARPDSFFGFHPTLTDDVRPPPSLDEPTAELRRYLSPPPLGSGAQLHSWHEHRHSQYDNPSPQVVERESRRRSSKNKKAPRGVRSPSPPGSNPIVRDLPAVVQLADCLPPSVRTEHASSPPIWLTQDGTPVDKTTAIALLYDPNANDGKGEPVGVRHREPRENRDFLRMFVCEMDMRRHGKLSEDLGTGRARLWLPPVTDPSVKAKSKKEGEGDVAGATPSVGTTRKKKPASQRLMCLSADDVL